jgi:ParB-like chromosome segregation protein Spo0J
MSDDLNIIYRNPVDLKPYENNSKIHTQEQIQQLVNIISEVGFINPIIIDDNDTVLAGHGCRLAAIDLQMASVPTVIKSGLSDAQKKSYVIADNKIGMNASFDEDILELELKALDDLGVDLTLTGFSEEELNKILQGAELLTEYNYKDLVDEKKYILMVEYDSESQLMDAFYEAKEKGFPCKIIE